ncbi:ATP-grasp domain-containing protein [Dactylosporangium darangshiense]|uniref:ATP-grasp domain-containing protein n=1 Tax=Dactylosporangium darangshiense TaxID=579108 RepID=A0ABP8DCT5_9ACTN
MRPLVLVGFVGAALPSLAQLQPPGSVIFVEEPDVVRKRQVRDKIAGSPLVRELIEWEFHLAGKADEFYNAHRGLEPAAIVPLVEYATPFAARLAERYGLPGSGYGAAQILRDKALLRQVAGAAGIANPESATAHGPDDVLAFMTRHPGPVVLKPANRQAAVGTQVLHHPAEVERAWAECTEQDEGIFVPDRPMELRMLVERCVEGPEFSVEMLVQDGGALFANVTGKRLFPGPRPVELAHVVPADIPSGLAARLVGETGRVIRAAGFRDGIVHCEWIVEDGVPFLVECAGRFAGDGIIELIQRAYPVELNRAYFAVMRGEAPTVPLPARAEGGAAVWFLSIEAGVVDRVQGVEEAAGAPGVFACDVSVAAGDTFGGLRSSWDRVGDVMVTAGDPAEALRLAEAAAALIRIDTVSPARMAVAAQ